MDAFAKFIGLVDEGMTIPSEYHPHIVLYLRAHFYPQESVLDIRKRATPLLREMRLAEDEVWSMVICAMEWLGTVPQEERAQMLVAYETIRLVA